MSKHDDGEKQNDILAQTLIYSYILQERTIQVQTKHTSNNYNNSSSSKIAIKTIALWLAVEKTDRKRKPITVAPFIVEAIKKIKLNR